MCVRASEPVSVKVGHMAESLVRVCECENGRGDECECANGEAVSENV